MSSVEGLLLILARGCRCFTPHGLSTPWFDKPVTRQQARVSEQYKRYLRLICRCSVIKC